MNSRRVTLLVVLVVALAGGAAFWATRDPGIDGDDGDDPTAPVIAARSGTLDPVKARDNDHRQPHPFGHFAAEFTELRQPRLTPDEQKLREKEAFRAAQTYASKVKIPAKPDGYSIDDLVGVLAPQVDRKTGIRVFTKPSPRDGAFRFTLDYESIPVDKLLDEIRGQSFENVKYFMTSQGLCIGTEDAVIEAQLEAAEIDAKERAKRDAVPEFLTRECRPDFQGAWIGPISKTLSEQTGVEIVVDEETWRNRRTMTWRADPLPLRQALDEVARKMRCVWRVRDDRVFLFRP